VAETKAAQQRIDMPFAPADLLPVVILQRLTIAAL